MKIIPPGAWNMTLFAFAETCHKECGRYVFLYQICSKLTVLQPKPRRTPDGAFDKKPGFMDSLSMTRRNSCQDYEALSLGQILRIPVLQQQLRTLDSS
jgi:hypothetical protein